MIPVGATRATTGGETAIVFEDLSVVLLIGGGSFLGGLVGYLISLRSSRARSTTTAQGDRALSVEGFTRALVGEQPGLRRRWRIGRTRVTRGRLEVMHFRWGLRFRPEPPLAVDVVDVDRSGVHRPHWSSRLRLEETNRLVPLTTATGARIQLALRAEDVDEVLDVLEGVPVPEVTGAPQTPERRLITLDPGPRTVRVSGRVALDSEGTSLHPADVAAQLALCVDEAARLLGEAEAAVADVRRVVIRTTDPHAVTPHVVDLALRLRAAGADPVLSLLGVERLEAPGQLVELDVTAVV